MPLYTYKGLRADGKSVKGMREAANRQVLKTVLQKQGIFLSEAHEKGANQAGQKRFNIKLGGGVSRDDVRNFTEQFSTLQKAAIPLVECLSALADQAEKPEFREVLSTIKRDVGEGSALNVAMAKHPKVFDSLYISMIRAGESSGSLDIVLERLSEFLDSQQKLRNKISGAMVYPIIMVIIGTLLMMGLFTFVLPRITKLFQQQRKPLPLITEILLGFADFMANFWPLVLAFIILLAYAFKKFKATPNGRKKWDRFKLSIPLIGKVVRLVALARFSRTLATLLASGVPLLKAMNIVKAILGNTILSEVVEEAVNDIREGESIAGPLKRSGEFPPLMTHMISVGERAGRLEEMLNSIANTYENQINTRIDALTSLLEPLMIVVMGGTVGFVIFAIILPIMQLSDGFG